MADHTITPGAGRRRLVLKWLTVSILLAALGLLAFWVSPWRPRLSEGLKADLRAAFKLRHTPHPARQFLALRYGSLDDPANRQKAFLGFFDLERIEGMHRIVELMPADKRDQNIADMAGWIADFRNGLSTGDRAALGAYLNSPAGVQMIQRATSAYLQRSVEYRSATAPVIVELMSTIDSTKNR